MLSFNIPTVIINLLVTVLTIIISIAITWGRIREKITNFETSLQDLKSCIYKSNGTNVYVAKEDYYNEMVLFNDKFSKIDDRISDVQVNIADLKSKVEILLENNRR